MYNQIRVHKTVEKESARCKKLYIDMKNQLVKLPRGSLSVNKGRMCRAVRENNKQYLVPLRGDGVLYKELKNRRYIRKSLPVLARRIELLDYFLKEDVIYDPKTIEAELPVQYKGIAGMNLFLDGDIDVESWINEPYVRNPTPFQEEHYTNAKVKMRSKSEAMIGSRLEDRGIIYKTEMGIKIGGKYIYPDFVILIPKFRVIVIWEHFGLVDNRDYMYDNLGRLIDYGKSGFQLGVNLFLTYEMRGRPLTIPEIDKVIDEILDIAIN